MINAIAATPVPENSNCSITSGFGGLPQSIRYWDNIPWETENLNSMWVPIDYSFTLSGVQDSGYFTSFFITIECTLADWWPEIEIITPNIASH